MKLRVLVVDDSVVIRRIVRESLESDPGIEVVGVAANGRIALAMVEQHSPDAITLDLEMPEMDGLQTLRALRARGVQTPVVMFSTLTERGALSTLDALAAGADDYVTKPSNVGNLQEAMRRIREELVPKLRALCARNSVPIAAPLGSPASLQRIAPQALRRFADAVSPRPETPAPLRSAQPGPAGPIEIVAIGTSTGGPNALAEVLPRIPADFPVPIVIVQHMPPTFTRFLAERLTATSEIAVREGKSGELVDPGNAWVAPGDFHMNVRRELGVVRLGIHQAPPENSCRPSVDVLFRSVAEVYGKNVLAVVMTGMGQDGLRGCEFIKEAGGQVVVQDEATSVVWGMPGFVARAGLADSVLPVTAIADDIIRKVNSGRPVLQQGTPVSRQPFQRAT